MSSLTPNIQGRDYWRSLEEYADSPEFREWQAKAGEPVDEQQLKLSRRRFMQVMAASMSLAGLTLTGCRRWPEENLAPYANRPEGRTPGTSTYYASQITRGGVATGLLIEAFDGRPIKIEGHPDHPYSLGATDAWTQASILNMYDPERSRRVFHGWGEGQGDQPRQRVGSSWEEFERFAREHFGARTGQASGTVAVLAEPSDSPSVNAMRQRFAEQFPQAQWYEWEPINRDNELAGARLALGQSVRPIYHFDQAQIIATFDADPLATHPAAVRHARDWGRARQQVDDDFRMSRVYAAEPTFTLIGSVADERLATRASQVPALVRGLAARLGIAGVSDVELNGSTDFINKLAADLQQHTGESLVIVGPEQPAETHALAWAINNHLNNLGQTITLVEEPANRERTQLEQIRELVQRMNAGEVDTLLLLGGNPVYDAPADLDFAAALANVETTIRLGDYHDETSQASLWHLPGAHYLESWGDGRAWDGTISLQQPLILPLFNGRTPIELLALLAGDEDTQGYDIVRRTAREQYLANASGNFEQAWRRLLHHGLLEGSAYSTLGTPSVTVASSGDAKPQAAGAEMELVLRVDPNVYDGRYANNGWLQELPGPLTKLTWDNAALVSVADAEANGWRQEDVIQLTVADRSMELPVFVMPGQARGVIVAHLGYGRTSAGHIGNGVGHDTYALRTSEALHIAPVQVERGRGRYRLATTQNHHLIDNTGEWGVQKRVGKAAGESGYVIQDIPLREYAEQPQALRRNEHGDLPLQIFQPPYGTEPKREGGPVAFNNPHAWGMSIDMNSCIGCNACVVACQAENNVPVVGKDQVLMSREMHWIRIDRYFKGDPKNEKSATAIVHQPMMCVHCENAPCEQVCPVNAAVHDTEGLNLQVYNRCVGTRYCSNNCPYKVRRFNYLDYHAQNVRDTRFPKPWLAMPDDQQRHDRTGTNYDRIRSMQFNPDVTVRMRGVMEKCTYCMQRLSRAKIAAKNQWIKGERDEPLVQEGEVSTACQQACATGAIVFGDLNKADSAVTKQQDKGRSYGVLNPELNTRPRTRYLAKLRNPANESVSGS